MLGSPSHLLETDSDEEEEARGRSDGASDDEESDEEGSWIPSETSDDDAPTCGCPTSPRSRLESGAGSSARAAGRRRARAEEAAGEEHPERGRGETPAGGEGEKGKKNRRQAREAGEALRRGSGVGRHHHEEDVKSKSF